ncbi:TonB-dependent siderophore receptor [Herbaspirillum lusitanum]|uniref:TonB-dependent siderophore receptor n=1 Tax=Herbaspirillum lusitanum TaxID=213312 RepID=A0ABW9AG24_9BURK
MALSLSAWLIAAAPVHGADTYADASGAISSSQAAQQHLRFDIAPGSMESVLNRFGRETGLLISFSTDTTAGLQSAGLRGAYSAAEGLIQILWHSGLEARPQAGGYVVQKGPASERASPTGNEVLPLVRVNAARDAVVSEGSGAYTIAAMSTATRMELTPRETPQAVGVVTRQQIDDRNMQSIEDLSAMSTGVNLSQNSYERSILYARGFPIGFFLQDGMPASSDTDSMGISTLAMYDRVEVMRGAAGLLTGIGDPAGLINLVRKRPTRESQVSLSTSLGRWNNRRVELDAGGALNQAQTLRGRMVVAYQDTDTFMNNYRHQRTLVYGTVDADLSRDTSLSLGLSYNQEDNPGASWYGLPAASDGSFLPLGRSLNTAPDWAYWNKINTRLFGELETRLADDWKLKVSMQWIEDHSNARVTGTDRAGSSENLFTLISANIYDYQRTQRGLEVQLGGPFALLGGRHEVLAGASYRTRDTRDKGKTAPGYSYTFDALSWNGSGAPLPDISMQSYSSISHVEQTGVYGSARLRLAEPLALLVGARADWYNYADDRSYLGGGGQASYQVRGEITPYIGVVYDLGKNFSLYGNRTSIFKPQASVDASGRPLDPVTGTNNELGIKGEFFDGALNASAAMFLIRQNNLPLALQGDLCKASASCAYASGEVESRGVEFDLTGMLTPAWQISAGYALTHARYTRDATTAKAGDQFNAPNQPVRMLHVSSMLKLPGALSQWRVGGTLRVQSETYVSGSPLVRQGGYALFDLMSGWQINRHLELRLSISNLFDKRYYQTVYNTVSGNTFGEPRNFSLTAKYTF